MKNFILILAVCLLFVGPLHANTIYTYTGNTFTTTVDNPNIPGNFLASHISLTLELVRPLGPNTAFSGLVVDPDQPFVHFTFTDGRVTLTDSSLSESQFFFAFFHFFSLATDDNEVPKSWWMDAEWTRTSNGISTLYELLTMNTVPGAVGLIQSDYSSIELRATGASETGRLENNPGTWTVTQVPEISSAFLLCVGLSGLLVVKRQSSL